MSLRKVHEDVIRKGGTVNIKGKHYSTIASLPSEADLSLGDTKKEEAAAEQIKRDIENLQKELSKVEAKKSDAHEAAKEEAKSAAKSEKSEAKEEAKPKAEAKSDAKK
jgi:hypothetical protein